MDYDIFDKVGQIRYELHKKIIGNEKVIDDILICLFSGGHILLESSPGMGKTMLSKTLSQTLNMSFKRVQCTPDLLPKDVLGELTMEARIGGMHFRPGPIFTNILLIDEINRAQPKTQSAFLQAMEEKSVTLAGENHQLPDPFLVIATQNPIEQVGTNELPEAQKDRFMLKTRMDYLNAKQEKTVMDMNMVDVEVEHVFAPEEIVGIRKEILSNIKISEINKEYIISIVMATRKRDEVSEGGGASTRANVQFLKAVKARAFINGRDYVTTEDVTAMALPVLRHRIRVVADKNDYGYTSDELISDILRIIPSPK